MLTAVDLYRSYREPSKETPKNIRLDIQYGMIVLLFFLSLLYDDDARIQIY